MTLREPTDSSQPASDGREPGSLPTALRVVLWFACLLVVLVVFSLMMSGPQAWSSFLIVFRVTSMMAVPVGCLYLPLVVKWPDAEGLRSLKLIGAGAVIGPLALAILYLLTARDPLTDFVSRGVEPGFDFLSICAFMVGAFTSALYAAALKAARHLLLSP